MCRALLLTFAFLAAFCTSALGFETASSWVEVTPVQSDDVPVTNSIAQLSIRPRGEILRRHVPAQGLRTFVIVTGAYNRRDWQLYWMRGSEANPLPLPSGKQFSIVVPWAGSTTYFSAFAVSAEGKAEVQRFRVGFKPVPQPSPSPSPAISLRPRAIPSPRFPLNPTRPGTNPSHSPTPNATASPLATMATPAHASPSPTANPMSEPNSFSTSSPTPYLIAASPIPRPSPTEFLTGSTCVGICKAKPEVQAQFVNGVWTEQTCEFNYCRGTAKIEPNQIVSTPISPAKGDCTSIAIRGGVLCFDKFSKLSRQCSFTCEVINTPVQPQ